MLISLLTEFLYALANVLRILNVRRPAYSVSYVPSKTPPLMKFDNAFISVHHIKM